LTRVKARSVVVVSLDAGAPTSEQRVPATICRIRLPLRSSTPLVRVFVETGFSCALDCPEKISARKIPRTMESRLNFVEDTLRISPLLSWRIATVLALPVQSASPRLSWRFLSANVSVFFICGLSRRTRTPRKGMQRVTKFGRRPANS
jgi:hypothetical protein